MFLHKMLIFVWKGSSKEKDIKYLMNALSYLSYFIFYKVLYILLLLLGWSDCNLKILLKLSIKITHHYFVSVDCSHRLNIYHRNAAKFVQRFYTEPLHTSWLDSVWILFLLVYWSLHFLLAFTQSSHDTITLPCLFMLLKCTQEICHVNIIPQLLKMPNNS